MRASVAALICGLVGSCTPFSASNEADGGAAPDGGAATDAAVVPAGPITFVQANASLVKDAKFGTVDFLKPVVSRDAIVFAFTYPSSGKPSISDYLQNTYKIGVADSPNGVAHAIAIAENINGGMNTVTLSFDAPMNELQLYIHEYAGLALKDPFDVGGSATGASSLPDEMASPFVTTTADRELLFGFGVADAVSVGMGWTPRSIFNKNITQDRIVERTGMYRATATSTTQSAPNWTMLIATFKGR